MAADDLVTQGARTSAAVALIKVSWNILAWAPEGLLLARARNKYAECERYGSLIYLQGLTEKYKYKSYDLHIISTRESISRQKS